MKSISASIVVLAGSILIIGSSRFTSETHLFVMVVGCGVGAVGLWGWFVSLKER
jgi:hypothetical protein